MIRDILEQILQLEDESDGILIVHVKPRNKRKVMIYDTDHAGFDIINNELSFHFWEDEYKDFTTKLDDIKNVNIEQYDGDMAIAHIHLKNGNTIMIHFMNNW